MEEGGGKWANSIFKVVDELIKHDVLSSIQTFALALGSSSDPAVFDLLSSVRKAQEDARIAQEEQSSIEKLKSRKSRESMIDEALTILETSGADRVRTWAKMDVLLKVVDDTTAATMLYYLQEGSDFTGKFVDDCLPRECCERGCNVTKWAYFVCGLADRIFGSNLQAAGTEDSVREAIEKTKRLVAEIRPRKTDQFQLVDVSKVVIMSAQNALEILRASVGEHQVTDERVDELLKAVEPYIYGGTPLMQAMRHSVNLFSDPVFSSHRKLLFIISAGIPTDGNDPPLQELRELGVTIVSCFVTDQQPLADPRHLYSNLVENWEESAKTMFRMSSTITTQKIPRTLFVKRGWKIDIDNNETKLFFQVNHPEIIKDVCDLAKAAVLSQDALSDLLSTVDLDMFINKTIDMFGAKRQHGRSCYANASAAVLHLAMKRIIGRDGGYLDFFELRHEMIAKYGEYGASTKRILEEVCPKYRLKCREVDAIGAMEAISAKQPVVARFCLSDAQWDQFYQFYEDHPKGILTRSYLDSKHHSTSKRTPSGHAVVLTSYDAKSLCLMNSWGDKWADNGFFRVQNANVLPGLRFFHVFWTLNSLSREEKRAYDQHGATVAAKLMRSLRERQAAEFGAKRQHGRTCYANASAAVLHLSMKRVVERDGDYQHFFDLRRELVAKYGEHGESTMKVLKEVCPNYRLQSRRVDAIGAMKAISAKRPVVARFFLSGAQWDQFYQFYEDHPKGILTRSYLDSKHHSTSNPGGHAVVLTSYDAESLRLMNSWGEDWADNGFFRVQNADVLGLEFRDVFWTLDSLSEKEKRAYDQRGAEIAARLMRSLQGSQAARYKCPLCTVESRVVDFSGHLLRTKCPSCSGTFNVNNAGGDLTLNLYLTSLMY